MGNIISSTSPKYMINSANAEMGWPVQMGILQHDVFWVHIHANSGRAGGLQCVKKFRTMPKDSSVTRIIDDSITTNHFADVGQLD